MEKETFEKKFTKKLHNLITNKKKDVFSYVILFFCVFVFAYKLFFFQKGNLKKYKNIKSEYVKFKKDNKNLNVLLKDIEKFNLLSYKNKIIQKLILKNDKRIKNFKQKEESIKELIPYSDYSKISFLVAKKEFKKALLESMKLEKKFENEKELKSLYFLNLLRISFLHKELKDNKKELSYIENIEKFLKKNKKEIKPILKKIEFQNSFLLKSYLENRKKVLS